MQCSAVYRKKLDLFVQYFNILSVNVFFYIFVLIYMTRFAVFDVLSKLIACQICLQRDKFNENKACMKECFSLKNLTNIVVQTGIFVNIKSEFFLLRWKHFHHFSACGGLHSASFACNFQLMEFRKSCVIAAVWHMKKRIGTLLGVQWVTHSVHCVVGMPHSSVTKYVGNAGCYCEAQALVGHIRDWMACLPSVLCIDNKSRWKVQNWCKVCPCHVLSRDLV